VPGVTLVSHFGHCIIYLHLPQRRGKVGAECSYGASWPCGGNHHGRNRV